MVPACLWQGMDLFAKTQSDSGSCRQLSNRNAVQLRGRIHLGWTREQQGVVFTSSQHEVELRFPELAAERNELPGDRKRFGPKQSSTGFKAVCKNKSLWTSL